MPEKYLDKNGLSHLWSKIPKEQVWVGSEEPTGDQTVWIDPTGSETAGLVTQAELANKQDKLTAGTNITIENNVISATGSGGGGSSYTFTDGLTETDGVVKWDLNDNIKTGEKVNGEQCIRTLKGKLAFGVGLGLEGRIFASGDGCLAGGFGNTNSITAGSGFGAVAIGVSDSSAGSVYASNDGSVALGHGTKSLSDYQVVIGKDNIGDSSNTYAHIVGNGKSNKSRSNAYTLDWQGNRTFAGTVSSSTGADYAEYFEWKDGNPNNEDRVGYIVCLDGDKIVKANTGDDILGICSGTAMVLGDSAEWNWSKRYLTDDFGRIIYEDYDIEHEEVKDDDGNIIREARIEHIHAPKQNPNYDISQPYIRRSDRSEWQIVGMMGKLYVRDDGSCVVNGYADVINGIATKATGKTNMRVMERINDSIVRVLLK